MKHWIKRCAALSLVAVLTWGMAGCNRGGTDKKTVTVWMPEEVVSLTQTAVDKWLDEHGSKEKYTVKVSAMGEDDAATNLLTDVEAAADVFGFSQDQLARLVSAGALSALGGTFLNDARQNNDENSVKAATLDGKVYAYPETSDNGYFLYYDKSVVTDPSTLEGILDQCAAKGKKLYMNLQSGWYSASFFFGTGCECAYTYDKTGKVTAVDCDYNSEKGLAAMKAMVNMAAHKGFGQSESAAGFFNPDGGTAGALISGTWDSGTVSRFLGDNFAAAKLPTFKVDGKTYQMGGFSGFKMVGVKPQTDAELLAFCHELAAFLTGEHMQLTRFNEKGWGPSNLKAQASEAVKQNVALAALNAQLEHCVPQGQYPNAYWSLTEAFGTDINAGKYKTADDTALYAALKTLEDGVKAAG